MDDSAVVVASPGVGPDELAAAYDEHAAALYGYCRWLLPDPAQAVDALIEALASTTARRDGSSEAGRLPPTRPRTKRRPTPRIPLGWPRRAGCRVTFSPLRHGHMLAPMRHRHASPGA